MIRAEILIALPQCLNFISACIILRDILRTVSLSSSLLSSQNPRLLLLLIHGESGESFILIVRVRCENLISLCQEVIFLLPAA